MIFLPGHEVVQLQEHDDYVEVLVTSDAEASKRFLSRYLLGCDGANSIVRRHMGVQLQDLGFYFDWLIVDTIPHEERVWSPMNWQLCDPARPTTIVAGGPGRRRWEFMRLPHESKEELNTADTHGSCSHRGAAPPRTPPWSVTPCIPSRRAGRTRGTAGGSCWPATRHT